MPAGSAVPWPAFYAVSVETLTFLFTDIEGSTALLGRLGDDVYAQVLAGHHALIRSALAAYDGREVEKRRPRPGVPGQRCGRLGPGSCAARRRESLSGPDGQF